MTRRIIELAVEALERRRAALDEEITQFRSGKAEPRPAKGGRGRKRTAAERKAQSDAMKAYWAKRRSQARPATPARGRRRRARRRAAV